jgi:hypothetical protein
MGRVKRSMQHLKTLGLAYTSINKLRMEANHERLMEMGRISIANRELFYRGGVPRRLVLEQRLAAETKLANARKGLEDQEMMCEVLKEILGEVSAWMEEEEGELKDAGLFVQDDDDVILANDDDEVVIEEVPKKE